MADPIVELITQNVVTTLSAITTGNGYQQTLTVERYNKVSGNNPSDKLAVVRQLAPTRVGEDDDTEGSIWWMQPYEVDVYLFEPEGSSTPIDQRINRARSDIEKRLLIDANRGDDGSNNALAQDTRIDDPELWEEGPYFGVTVRFTVKYSTAHGDPYAVR